MVAKMDLLLARAEYAKLRKSCSAYVSAKEFDAQVSSLAYELADGEEKRASDWLRAAEIVADEFANRADARDRAEMNAACFGRVKARKS